MQICMYLYIHNITTTQCVHITCTETSLEHIYTHTYIHTLYSITYILYALCRYVCIYLFT